MESPDSPTGENSPTLQRLVDTLLGGQLDAFVSERRATGRAWRLISRDIYEATKVDVTYETLRRWYPELAERAS